MSVRRLLKTPCRNIHRRNHYRQLLQSEGQTGAGGRRGAVLSNQLEGDFEFPSSGLSQKRFHALLVNFAIISPVNLASQ